MRRWSCSCGTLSSDAGCRFQQQQQQQQTVMSQQRRDDERTGGQRRRHVFARQTSPGRGVSRVNHIKMNCIATHANAATKIAQPCVAGVYIPPVSLFHSPDTFECSKPFGGYFSGGYSISCRRPHGLVAAPPRACTAVSYTVRTVEIKLKRNWNKTVSKLFRFSFVPVLYRIRFYLSFISIVRTVLVRRIVIRTYRPICNGALDRSRDIKPSAVQWQCLCVCDILSRGWKSQAPGVSECVVA